jgi:hypothetical protein
LDVHKAFGNLTWAHIERSVRGQIGDAPKQRASDEEAAQMRQLNAAFDDLVGLILDDDLRARVEEAAKVSRSLYYSEGSQGEKAGATVRAMALRKEGIGAIAARIREIYKGQ